MPLQEAIDGLRAGDVDTGKALLRDYVNGTMGFERLGALTQIPAKSLMRMLGPKGNPQARTLFDVIGHLQRAEGVRYQVLLKNTKLIGPPVIARKFSFAFRSPSGRRMD